MAAVTICSDFGVRHGYITILDSSSDTCFTVVHSLLVFPSEEQRDLKKGSHFWSYIWICPVLSQFGERIIWEKNSLSIQVNDKKVSYPYNYEMNDNWFLITFLGLHQTTLWPQEWSNPSRMRGCQTCSLGSWANWSWVQESWEANPGTRSRILPWPLLSSAISTKPEGTLKCRAPDVIHTVITHDCTPHPTVSIISCSFYF